MKPDLFIKMATVLVAILLALSLVSGVTTRVRASAGPEAGKRVQYRILRVDASTNQDLLFEKAGDQGLELVGTIEIAGNTGYLIFKK